MTCRELVEKLRNVHAVNVTPFRDDRSIDYEGLEENIQFLLEDGVEEAATVTRFVTEKVDGRAMVLAGVGHDLKTAQEMTVAAQNAGRRYPAASASVSPSTCGTRPSMETCWTT